MLCWFGMGALSVLHAAEIGYDTGTMGVNYAASAGRYFAVRFTNPNPFPVTVQAIKIWGQTGITGTLDVHLWDSDAGVPGSALASLAGQTLGVGGFNRFDVSSRGVVILPDEDLFAGFDPGTCKVPYDDLAGGGEQNWWMQTTTWVQGAPYSQTRNLMVRIEVAETGSAPPGGTLITLGPAVPTAGWSTTPVTNTLPFQADFEAQSEGSLLGDLPGWMKGESDLSCVTNRTYLFDEPCGLPLPSSTHANVLRLSTEAETACALLERKLRGNDTYVDLMVSFVLSGDVPAFGGGEPMAAVFADADGNLNLRAAWLDELGTRTTEWFVLTPVQPVGPPESGVWHRLTLLVRKDGDGSNDFIKVVFDGTALTHEKARINPEQPETGGEWFCLIRDEDNPLPALGLAGSGYVDDIRIFDPQPTFPPEITACIAGPGRVTVTWTSQSGWRYELQSKPSLAGSTWLPVTNVVAGSSSCSADAPVQGATNAFFRVSVPY